MSNSTSTARNDLVQILSHANGTFDVLYNVPEHYESGWGNLVLAVLTGVCTHIANKDGIVEDACHYRDVSDLVRARKFMEEVAVRVPTLSLFRDLTENFSTRPIKSGVLDLGLLADFDLEDFSMSIQSILLSGSVLTNPVENSRGLVTVTAKFGEEIFKVRLTGFIPKAIAEVLRRPYEYVTNICSGRLQDLEQGNTKPVRTSRGLAQKQVQAEIDGMISEVAGMIGALNDIQRRLTGINTAFRNTESQQQSQTPTDASRQSSSKTRRELHQGNMQSVQQQQSQQQRQFVKSQMPQRHHGNDDSSVAAGSDDKTVTIPVLTRSDQEQQESVSEKRDRLQKMTHAQQRQELKKDLQNLREKAVDLQTNLSSAEKQGEGEQHEHSKSASPVICIPVLPRKPKSAPRHSTGEDQVRHAFGDKLLAALKGRNDGPSDQELVEIDALKDAPVVEVAGINMVDPVQDTVFAEQRV